MDSLASRLVLAVFSSKENGTLEAQVFERRLQNWRWRTPASHGACHEHDRVMRNAWWYGSQRNETSLM